MSSISKIRISDNPALSPLSFAKVTTMGNVTEVLTMKKRSNGCCCRKIDKDHFVDMRTGEVRDYKHIENRSQSIDSIRRSLSNIRALINTNVVDPSNVRWVTLTYAENMTDTNRLYSDYFKFWKRFLYWCKKNGYSKPEYISVQEPQGRGAWHVHAFFIWDTKAPYIPNEVMAELWRHGFTSTKAMQNCDNVGAYFSAYLGDMPLDEVETLPVPEKEKALSGAVIETKKFEDELGHSKEKKFVKGGRLYLYPPGMNIVRSSRGVKLPSVEYMMAKMAQKKVSAATETFSRAYEILDDNGAVVNVISKTYYNSARKKKQ